MNASWTDGQAALHDCLGDAPRGSHAKSVPGGNGPRERPEAADRVGDALVELRSAQDDRFDIGDLQAVSWADVAPRTILMVWTYYLSTTHNVLVTRHP